MSVLIKGMEMPASCLACPMCEQGTIHEWELYCGLTGDYIGHWDDKSLNNGHRPDVCPLVEVPTPHGDLIDRDKLLKKGINLSWSVQKWVSEVDIGLMRAIIEAEEGEA